MYIDIQTSNLKLDNWTTLALTSWDNLIFNVHVARGTYLMGL